MLQKAEDNAEGIGSGLGPDGEVRIFGMFCTSAAPKAHTVPVLAAVMYLMVLFVPTMAKAAYESLVLPGSRVGPLKHN